jgi:hypothetical protein
MSSAPSFPLHSAASAGNLEKVEELLSGGLHGRGIRLHIDDVDIQGRWEWSNWILMEIRGSMITLKAPIVA